MATYTVGQGYLVIAPQPDLFRMHNLNSRFSLVRNLKYTLTNTIVGLNTATDMPYSQHITAQSFEVSGEMLDTDLTNLMAISGMAPSEEPNSLLLKPLLTKNGTPYRVDVVSEVTSGGNPKFRIALDRSLALTEAAETDDIVYAYPIASKRRDWEDTIGSGPYATAASSSIQIAFFDSNDNHIATLPVADIVNTGVGAAAISTLDLHGEVFKDKTLAQVRQIVRTGMKVAFAALVDGQKPCNKFFAAKLIFPFKKTNGVIGCTNIWMPKAVMQSETVELMSSHTETSVVPFTLRPLLIDPTELGGPDEPPLDDKLKTLGIERAPVWFEKTIIPHSCKFFGI